MRKTEGLDIPDLLTMQSGDQCDNVQKWETVRRKEILSAVMENLYGRYPGKPDKIDYTVVRHEGEALGGIAIAETVQVICYGPADQFEYLMEVVRPKNLATCGAIVQIAGEPLTKETRAKLPPEHPFMDRAEEKIVTCGFASIKYYCRDLDPETGFQDSILRIFPEDREPDACRTIGAWSMGGLIAMDYMACHEGFDLEQTAIVGCSRYGKTALWTGVNEPRYRMVGLVESGHGGAAMARGTDGEKVANLSKAFNWTCENYRGFAGRDEALPYDAHMLLSLIAPRFLYVCSARDDYWCDPAAELLSVRMVGKVYELYGLKGISIDRLPDDQTPDNAGAVGYHYRNGSHGFSNYDLQCFLAFAVKKFSGPRNPTGTQ